MQLSLFKLLSFTLYFTLSTIGAMLIPFLQYKGYNPGQIGLLISIYTVSGVAGQFLTGFFCDKLCTVKKIFIPTLFILIVSMTVAISFGAKWIFLIGFLISGLMQYILIAIYDSWVIESSEEIKARFGQIRACGSIGWAIGVLIIGYIISRLGYFYVNVIYAVGLVICIIIAIKTNDINKKTNKCIKLSNIKNLFSNKEYIIVIFSLLVISIPLRAYYQLSPYIIEMLGKGTFEFGIFNFICSISEIVTLFLTTKVFRKISPDKFLKIAPIAILIKLIMLYFASNIIIVYLSAILQIFTFPVILMVGKLLIDRLCTDDFKTSSQLMGFAVFNSMGIVIASSLTGYLIINLGINNTIAIFILLAILGIIVSIYCDKKIKDKTI